MRKKTFLIITTLLGIILFSTQKCVQKVKAQTALPTPIAVGCGNIYTDNFTPIGDPLVIHVCTCEEFTMIDNQETEITYCCGWWHANSCHATEPVGPIDTTPTPPPPTSPGSIIVPPVDKNLLNSLNPLKNYSSKADQLSTPGGIISEILTYSFPIAGVILFVMLIVAGFKMLTGASNSSGIEEAKKMISTAIIGFIILFAAYWIAQLIEIIFGIRILGIRQLD